MVATCADTSLLQDPIVTQPYEPGSVMKMLTATSAIENHVVTPNTRILDSSVLRFGPSTVHNWDGKGMGRMPFRDIIAFSRNVGVSRVAARLGRTTARAASKLYATWQQLGIGVRTGVDVAGEVPGMAPDPRQDVWAPIDLANRAFGQGVTATPIQLANAFTPMINGGTMVQPHFLVAIGGTPQAVTPGTRVLPKKVAEPALGHPPPCDLVACRGTRRVRSSGTTRWAARRARHRSGIRSSGRSRRLGPALLQLHVRRLRRR